MKGQSNFPFWMLGEACKSNGRDTPKQLFHDNWLPASVFSIHDFSTSEISLAVKKTEQLTLKRQQLINFFKISIMSLLY